MTQRLLATSTVLLLLLPPCVACAQEEEEPFTLEALRKKVKEGRLLTAETLARKSVDEWIRGAASQDPQLIEASIGRLIEFAEFCADPVLERHLSPIEDLRREADAVIDRLAAESVSRVAAGKMTRQFSLQPTNRPTRYPITFWFRRESYVLLRLGPERCLPRILSSWGQIEIKEAKRHFVHLIRYWAEGAFPKGVETEFFRDLPAGDETDFDSEILRLSRQLGPRLITIRDLDWFLAGAREEEVRRECIRLVRVLHSVDSLGLLCSLCGDASEAVIEESMASLSSVLPQQAVQDAIGVGPEEWFRQNAYRLRWDASAGRFELVE